MQCIWWRGWQIPVLRRVPAFSNGQWVSNSHTVLMSIPEERRAKKKSRIWIWTQINFQLRRVPGLQWCIETDEFKFRTSVQDCPQTRSVISLLCDPLGILASFSMTAKLLLQELYGQNLKWDDVILHSLSRKWLDWLEDLLLISSFKVGRCIKPSCIRQSTISSFLWCKSRWLWKCVAFKRITSQQTFVVAFIVGKESFLQSSEANYNSHAGTNSCWTAAKRVASKV